MQKIIQRRPTETRDQLLDSDMHPVLRRVYLARGITDSYQISNDLSLILKPEKLKGLAQAVALVVEALQHQQRILVIGDFDADGATSSALAVLALRAMGAEAVDFLVPNRFEFGYGLTPEIVAVAERYKPDLIITVDNGISSIAGVASANALGIKVLVTDHHLPGDELPQASAIVNPNQPGCAFPSKNLAGVGVIFYLMSALRARLRETGWFESQGLIEPTMADYLDLVALGTVADVVPLDHNNRILVEQGLRRIRAGRTRPGIAALLAVANRDAGRLVSSDLGFAIGPRLNAAGRLDDMSLGIQCLMTNDAELAAEMARQMDDLNRDRKTIEGSMQQEALKSLEAIGLREAALPFGLCLYDANWHQGVVGILASRIKDRYHRPVIAFADADESGLIKGSARSVPGLHIRDTLDMVAAKHPRLLNRFGGHAMAAGLTINQGDYAEFAEAFDQAVRSQLTEQDLQAIVMSDGELDEQQFELSLAQQLKEAGPWGQHFPEPLFDGEFHLVQQRIVGEKHLKLVIAPAHNKGQVLDAIAFFVDTATWPDSSVDRVRLVYKLDVNEYMGRRSLQLIVELIEPVSG